MNIFSRILNPLSHFVSNIFTKEKTAQPPAVLPQTVKTSARKVRIEVAPDLSDSEFCDTINITGASVLPNELLVGDDTPQSLEWKD